MLVAWWQLAQFLPLRWAKCLVADCCFVAGGSVFLLSLGGCLAALGWQCGHWCSAGVALVVCFCWQARRVCFCLVLGRLVCGWRGGRRCGEICCWAICDLLPCERYGFVSRKVCFCGVKGVLLLKERLSMGWRTLRRWRGECGGSGCSGVVGVALIVDSEHLIRVVVRAPMSLLWL